MSPCRRAIFLGGMLLASGCGGESPSDPGPGTRGPVLRLVAGAALGDTINALPVDGLVAEVIGANGRAAPGVTVLFRALVAEGPNGPAPVALLLPTVGTALSTERSETTDARGQAGVRLRMGFIAGQGRIVVSAPDLGLVDTARIVVRPGDAVQIRFGTADTIMGVDRTVPVTAMVLDRARNPRPEVPTIAARTPTCSFAAGTARGLQPGSCAITATFGTMTDTLRIGVTPPISVLMGGFTNTGGAAYRLNLSTGVREVLASGLPGFEVYAVESRGDLVFRAGDRLVLLGSDGRRIDPLATFAGLTWSGWARWTRTRDWVYFAGNLGIMRVRPDGTLPQRIAPFGTVPDPSPAGDRLVWSYDGDIYLASLAAPIVPAPIARGWMPRWSPDGRRLAFISQGVAYTMRPDGSDIRALSGPGFIDSSGLDWSEDGEWLITISQTSLALLKADGTFGYTLPIAVPGQVSVVRP